MVVKLGYRYRLRTPTTAVTLAVNGRRNIVMIPLGSIIRVVSMDPGGSMVVVAFQAKRLTMFCQDLADRGEEVAPTWPS